ncbi:AMP-binding protein [Methylobacterium haplocladii]|uniref:Long-chain-fatty-acid--CoA ligase n=1 Tax=Methylobacterium haplocladii TaxID=1176176 RepID=A0A512IPM8_9HYPH|nr:AMP-binding protein [Methylobacterium haplocladii]GEO99656.1 long-chain-fatty-acid--CoA ligase [Methylobacterium haplocladii]GJD83350.1 Long-chain-fatty-acid--CoA ligase [Methylobacterium haplocladii]GLS58225.1 long-chain-fatty-acid--CoA ligase [Methylobacterium haplocladii]
MADPVAGDRSGARPWLSAYPPGVPAEIDVERLGTLVDLIDHGTAAYADRPALISFGKSVSYGELGAASDGVSSWLGALGMAKGDRVALMMPNVAAYPAALLGVLVAGCTAVNVNPLYTPRELIGQLDDSGARILFVLENFAHTVAEALPKLPKLERVVIVGPGDCLGLKGKVIDIASRYIKRAVPPFALPPRIVTRFDAVLRAGRKLPRHRIAVGPDDLAFLQYTGGTTGIAKAAMLTHRNIVANVEQCRTWFRVSGEDGQERVMVTALPLYHIFALTACFFFFLDIGGCCLLIANPRDVDGFVKTLASSRFTHLSGVNTLYNLLVNHPKLGTIDFSGNGYHIAGGMAVQAAVAAKWKAATGRVLIEGYGLSETSPVATINPVDLDEWSGTIGYPVSSTDITIRDADGRDVPYGEPGELCVRGPQVMAGYWKRPDETRAAMTEDGYFRTGDVATMAASGAVRIVDRMKDMILVSGFNVYPNEVEDVLAKHPSVLECAVVGSRCEDGEVVVAHVVMKGEAVAPEVLKAHARSELTGYKVPRRIVFHESLPKTNVGKVLRRALRDLDS